MKRFRLPFLFFAPAAVLLAGCIKMPKPGPGPDDPDDPVSPPLWNTSILSGMNPVV